MTWPRRRWLPVQVVEVDGGLTADAALGGPEHDLAGLRVDEPPVLVIGLVRQCGGDLLQVKLTQVKHLVEPPGRGAAAGGGSHVALAVSLTVWRNARRPGRSGAGSGGRC